jgi:DNA-binding transcriptional regulator YhcF (GntR family)
MSWALKQPVKTTEKLLLLVISNYADEQGRAWPSVETLARDTGMSRATIKRSMRKLEDAGFVRRQKRTKAQLQISNLYTLKCGSS